MKYSLAHAKLYDLIVTGHLDVTSQQQQIHEVRDLLQLSQFV